LPAVTDQAAQQRRTWVAIALSTALVTVSFWAIVYAFVTEAVGDDRQPVAAGALGVALVPFVFILMAFVSGHPNAPLAILYAMGLALVVGIPLLALAGDAVTGTVMGFGAGATLALRPDPASSWARRAVAVVISGVIVFALVLAFTPLALATAPALAVTPIGIADLTAEP
jgi:hypothetical protein